MVQQRGRSAYVAFLPNRSQAAASDEVEYINGSQRTLLFRVRYGSDMLSRHIEWRGHADFKQSAEDAEYYRKNPPV